jgi:hypothetical protein
MWYHVHRECSSRSRLVVKDLISGLHNRDDPEDLQRRLELLSINLEELFKDMVSIIESFYLDKAAENISRCSSCTFNRYKRRFS